MTQLPNDEWIALFWLSTAANEGETPIPLREFVKMYLQREDISNVQNSLEALKNRELASMDFDQRWFPTRKGKETVNFDKEGE